MQPNVTQATSSSKLATQRYAQTSNPCFFSCATTASKSLANTPYHDNRHKKGVFAQASTEMRNFLINSYRSQPFFMSATKHFRKTQKCFSLEQKAQEYQVFPHLLKNE